jgi:glycosyltransferase involved in cell wall biosynthesis
MRVLILHDYLDNIGGGEKLMLALARGIKADVATLDYNPALVEAMGFRDVNVFGFGTTPRIPPLKQIIASLRFKLLDMRDSYDFFVFSGNWSHYAARVHHPNLWYCHTPVRAFYSDFERLSLSLPAHSRLFFDAWARIHGRFDRHSIRNVGKIVVNSKNTQARVKKYYGRESVIVYPGIDAKRFRFIESGDYWLSVNRMYPEKRVDLQVEAFRRMPDERLVIVGGNLAGDHSSAYANKIISNLPKNVEYLGRVDEGRLAELYGRCRGFVCTAVDEDFGMTPLEAMAAGKPVVACREGGYLETVLDGVTGVFIDSTVEALVDAIRRVGDGSRSYRGACEQRALEFDTSRFIERMEAEIRGF